ncbi:sugar phosphate isomerase/epimerase [Pseudonocardia eucalypti]|uniref:Sugar phosphate isomerase/epimerase n=1 Tax=Pseudonocardia eucalypti TaxID=648755 RepID=A0ABP9PKH9_9PSEU|nr:sugar phosphate isomerase/epimerase [Pseudonocardia eucalypti]
MSLSINRESVKQWKLPELVDGCAVRGITGVGLWRYDVEAYGAAGAAELVRDAGLEVTSLCRGGFFTRLDRNLEHNLDDNRRAIDEAAALETDVLALVCGGLQDLDLRTARQRVADAITELAPYAAERGVRLGIEPLHPMFCSDRSVVSTLGQAVELAERAGPAEAVGVVVDAYHVWWDPELDAAVRRAGEGGRIVAFQVSDWVTPLPAGVLTGRALMGDGCIRLAEMRDLVEAAGYTGPVEVEIFNDELWARPGAEALDLIIERYRSELV